MTLKNMSMRLIYGLLFLVMSIPHSVLGMQGAPQPVPIADVLQVLRGVVDQNVGLMQAQGVNIAPAVQQINDLIDAQLQNLEAGNQDVRGVRNQLNALNNLIQNPNLNNLDQIEPLRNFLQQQAANPGLQNIGVAGLLDQFQAFANQQAQNPNMQNLGVNQFAQNLNNVVAQLAQDPIIQNLDNNNDLAGLQQRLHQMAQHPAAPDQNVANLLQALVAEINRAEQNANQAMQGQGGQIPPEVMNFLNPDGQNVNLRDMNLGQIAGQAAGLIERAERFAEMQREMEEMQQDMGNMFNENELFGDMFRDIEEAPFSFFLGYAIKDRNAEQTRLDAFKEDALFEHEIYRDRPQSIQAGVYGKDLLYCTFFLLKWAIDQKLHQKFDEYYLKGIFANFSAQKKQLVSLVQSSMDGNEGDDELVKAMLCDEALEIFSIKKELNLKMYTHLCMHWLALMGVKSLEEGVNPSDEQKPLIVSWLDYCAHSEKRYADLRDERGLRPRWWGENDDPQVMAEIDAQLPVYKFAPVPSLLWLVHKYLYGISVTSFVADCLTGLRPRALGFAKICYPEDHLYHKFLDACDTISSHQAFSVAKELCLWTRAIKQLHLMYKNNSRNFFAKNADKFLEIVLDVAAAEDVGDSDAIKVAEEKLIDFIKMAHCVSFKDWFQCKESSMARINLAIESVLLIPGAIEAGKCLFGFMRANNN